MQTEEPTKEELYEERRTDELHAAFVETGLIEYGGVVYDTSEVIANIYDKPENGKAWDEACRVAAHCLSDERDKMFGASLAMEMLITFEAGKIIEDLIEKEMNGIDESPQ